MSATVAGTVIAGASLADTLYQQHVGGGGGGGSGGGGSGGGPTYTPTWIGGADQGWQQGYEQNEAINKNAYNNANPAYLQAYNNSKNINYQPYQTAENQAGQQYNNVSNIANTQMGQYQNQGMQDFSAANQLYQNAFDPNQAQFNQTQNILQNQVNAGQAMRGLGTSGQGAQEYNNAMQNLDIGWHTQQLQNEQIGLQGMGQAQQAGQRNFGAATQAGDLGAQDRMLGASTPLQASQMIANMPATNAAAYTNNLQNLEGMYGNQMSQAIPYMDNGQGAQQWNTNYNTAQNAANMQALTQGAQQLSNSYNQPGSWLNNMFSGQGSTGQTYNDMTNQNQSYINSYQPQMQSSVTDQSVNSTLSQIPSFNPYGS